MHVNQHTPPDYAGPDYAPETPLDPSHPMHDNIVIRAYPDPAATGDWAGYIEDKNCTWIIWLDASGRPALFNGRRDSNGAVLDEGIRLQ